MTGPDAPVGALLRKVAEAYQGGSVRYKARKDVEVSGANRKGEVIGPISFKTGSYSTNDPDEIALLDELATTQESPIGFDPKEEK